MIIKTFLYKNRTKTKKKKNKKNKNPYCVETFL